MYQEPYARIDFKKIDTSISDAIQRIQKRSEERKRVVTSDARTIEYLTSIQRLGKMAGHVYMTTTDFNRFNKYIEQ